MQRAVYLEAELRSLQQGDMSINAYCTKLKQIADQLRDINHPVFEPSQVLNLLHGLNPRYRYVKPVITSKYLPHTFQTARSFLILEELSVEHDANVESSQALAATHGDSSNGSSNSVSGGQKDGSSSSTAPRSNNGGNGRSNNRQDRRRGHGRGNGDTPLSNNPNAPNSSNAQSTPWAAGYNPWQGMVQAWPMPFRAPGAGVLGPCPPFQPQQAMAATHLSAPPPGGSFDTSPSTPLFSSPACHTTHRARRSGTSTQARPPTCRHPLVISHPPLSGHHLHTSQ
jgi:hypothetical protein